MAARDVERAISFAQPCCASLGELISSLVQCMPLVCTDVLEAHFDALFPQCGKGHAVASYQLLMFP